MELIGKIKAKEAKIGVIGLGYVGLPLVIEFCKAGFSVTGFDVDPSKVEKLLRGESYIKHIDSVSLSACRLDGNFIPTTGFNQLSAMDCIVICVPTPLNKYRELDLSFVFDTTMVLPQGHLIWLCSWHRVLNEKEIERKVDIGFEHYLKPAEREKIREQIVYV